MTTEQFCFWLHGFFELTGTDEVTPEQAKMIREHLDLVFEKVTPELQKSKDSLAKAIREMRHEGPGRTC